MPATLRPWRTAAAAAALWAGVACAWFSAVHAATCAYEPGMPARVLSLRESGWGMERYATLADEWGTYVKAHPRSAIALVNLWMARSYAHTLPAEGYADLLREAAGLAPDCPQVLATLGAHELSMSTWSGEATLGLMRLKRAIALAPELRDPRFALFGHGLRTADQAMVAEQARALQRLGAFPPFLMDHAYNLLMSAEPGGIVLTNGDNDTFPTVALQSIHGLRPDVRIVNVSLCRFVTYVRPLLATTPGSLISQADVDNFRDPKLPNLIRSDIDVSKELVLRARDGRARAPVYIAVTVPLDRFAPVTRSDLALEGLLYRVLPRRSAASSNTVHVEAARIDSLMTHVYRLESATDLSIDWSDTPLRSLAENYVAAFYRAAVAHAAAGDLIGVRRMLRGAVRLLQENRGLRAERPEILGQMLDYWKEVDPDNPEVDALESRIGK